MPPTEFTGGRFNRFTVHSSPDAIHCGHSQLVYGEWRQTRDVILCRRDVIHLPPCIFVGTDFRPVLDHVRC